MQRVAFKMNLFEGCAAEYKKRHDELWNDLKQLLKQTGVADYSIFLDDKTNFLFAYLTVEDVKKLGALSQEPVMKKWWAYMKDIMQTNEDGAPVVVELKEVFYLQ